MTTTYRRRNFRSSNGRSMSWRVKSWNLVVGVKYGNLSKDIVFRLNSKDNKCLDVTYSYLSLDNKVLDMSYTCTSSFLYNKAESLVLTVRSGNLEKEIVFHICREAEFLDLEVKSGDIYNNIVWKVESVYDQFSSFKPVSDECYSSKSIRFMLTHGMFPLLLSLVEEGKSFLIRANGINKCYNSSGELQSSLHDRSGELCSDDPVVIDYNESINDGSIDWGEILRNNSMDRDRRLMSGDYGPEVEVLETLWTDIRETPRSRSTRI